MNPKPPGPIIPAPAPLRGPAPGAYAARAPLEESVLDSSRPKDASTIALGQAVGMRPECGAWRLAALEKKELVTRLGRIEVFTDPNRCILHSRDYRLQLTVRVPPGEGMLAFSGVWYPPDVRFSGTYLISLAAFGKGRADRLDCEHAWPDRTLYDDFLRIRLAFPVGMVELADAFGLYATPYAHTAAEHAR